MFLYPHQTQSCMTQDMNSYFSKFAGFQVKHIVTDGARPAIGSSKRRGPHPCDNCGGNQIPKSSGGHSSGGSSGGGRSTCGGNQTPKSSGGHSSGGSSGASSNCGGNQTPMGCGPTCNGFKTATLETRTFTFLRSAPEDIA